MYWHRSHLDEFFIIRVASLLRKQRTNTEDVTTDGMTTGEQVAQVRKQAAEMLSKQAKCWTQELRPLLADHHIQFLEPAEFTPAITHGAVSCSDGRNSSR